MFFAFWLVTRRETFLPHPLLFLNLPLMSSYWSTLDDFSKIVIWTVSTNKDPMERHNWGEISKVFAKMFEHVKTIIPGKIPMKSSKKTQTVGELISFSPAGWNILVVAAPEFSWPEFVPRILLLMATAHLRLCLQHKEHVAAKSSRNVLSVRNVVIEQQ